PVNGGVMRTFAENTYLDDALRAPRAMPALAYDGDGLVTAVIQQYDTGEVLRVVRLDAAAVERTVRTRALGGDEEIALPVIDVNADRGGGALLVAADAGSTEGTGARPGHFDRSLYRLPDG